MKFDDDGDLPYGEGPMIGAGQVLNPSQVFPAGADFALTAEQYGDVLYDVAKVVIFGQFIVQDAYRKRTGFDFKYSSSGRDFMAGNLLVERLQKHIKK